MIDWSMVLNASAWGLFGSACLVAGFALWDRNGRRKVAALWWLLAIFGYLTGASWIISSAIGTGHPLSRWLQDFQWIRTTLLSTSVYVTVVVARRERRATVLTLVQEYGPLRRASGG